MCVFAVLTDVTNIHVATCWGLLSRASFFPSPAQLPDFRGGQEFKGRKPCPAKPPTQKPNSAVGSQNTILRCSGSRGRQDKDQDAGFIFLMALNYHLKVHRKYKWISLVSLILPRRLFITLSVCKYPLNTGFILQL